MSEDDDFLGDGGELDGVKRLVEGRRQLVHVDDHHCSTLALKECLEESREARLAKGHDLMLIGGVRLIVLHRPYASAQRHQRSVDVRALLEAFSLAARLLLPF